MAAIQEILSQDPFALLLMFLFGIVACLQLFFYYKLSRLDLQLKELLKGAKGNDLESLLLANRAHLERLDIEHREIQDKITYFERLDGRNLRRVGLIRYNAFKESGGNMSYSLAMLNDGGNGILITGIFTQEHGRSYVKPIRNWSSGEHPLTEEEEKAIKLAYKDTGSITQ